MSNLIVFDFNDNVVRFVDGKPVANDVAKALGYADPSKTVSTKVDEAYKGVTDLVTPGGKQSVTILEEAGIYQLIFSSKLESAKIFQKWVFEEVLPSIRKTGKFSIQGELKKPERQLPPVRDIIDYANASKTINSLPDSHTKRLLDKMLTKTLAVQETNDYLALKATEEKPKQYTTAPVRAKDLGYSVEQIKDGGSLGKFVKKLVKPEFQDYSGQFLTWHYEINDAFDAAIHAYFNRQTLRVVN